MALSSNPLAEAFDAPASGEAIYLYSRNHPGVAALHRFNDRLSKKELPRERLLVFFASMTAFVRHITPGIPALASRLSDALLPQVPYRAHGIAAHILDASVDEYGLSGTKPHAELLRDFAAYFGLGEAEINATDNAVPAANEIGEKMFGWYRQSPIPFALGMHTASEVTGYEEAHGFNRAFLTPPKYGLTAETPAFAYVATHVDNEEDHSRDVVICLDEYLALQPGSAEEILAGCTTFMDTYQRMFEQMEAAVFDG